MSGEGPRPWLSAVLSGAGALALVGFSLGLCVWELWFANRLYEFVVANGPSRARAASAVVFALAGAGVVLLLSLVLLVRRRLARAEAIERLSRRLSPLVLAALLPLMFHWQFWQGDREVIFLLLVLVLVFGVQRLLQVALSTEPVFGRPGFLDRTFRDGQELWQWSAPFLPFATVCLAAAGYAAFFSYHTVVHHWNVLSTSLDLGLEENVIWNALHSGSLFKSTPYGGPTGNLVGEHAAYLSYLIAPIYGLHQKAETLLVLQSVLIGGAAIPLYLVARKYLGPWLSCLVAVWYLLYPPLHGSNLYDFHYPPLAPFFLWFTLYFVLARKNIWAVVFAIVTLSVREDISLGLVIFGAFLALTDRRPRAGLLLAAAGAVYFVAMKMIVMPIQRGGQEAFIHQYVGLLPEGKHGFGGVVETVIGNPVFTLGVALERDKLIYLLEIFLPLAFFPLRRPIGLLCCVPGFLFTLLSTGYRPLYQISFQYTAHWTAYLFIAVIANLAWLSREAARRGRAGTAWKRAWVAAVSLAMLVTTYQLGALMQQHAVRGGFGIYHFGTNPEDWERRQKLRALIALVPAKAKIVSSENIVPQISNRAFSYTLRMGIADADYLLFSVPIWGEERAKVIEVLSPGTFGVVSERGQFVLAKRGHRTDLNWGILAGVGR
jgi:Predicted membrane protein